MTLRGKNTVICAPTGSGKTEVGIYVALCHLDEKADKNEPARITVLVIFFMKGLLLGHCFLLTCRIPFNHLKTTILMLHALPVVVKRVLGELVSFPRVVQWVLLD